MTNKKSTIVDIDDYNIQYTKNQMMEYKISFCDSIVFDFLYKLQNNYIVAHNGYSYDYIIIYLFEKFLIDQITANKKMLSKQQKNQLKELENGKTLINIPHHVNYNLFKFSTENLHRLSNLIIASPTFSRYTTNRKASAESKQVDIELSSLLGCKKHVDIYKVRNTIKGKSNLRDTILKIKDPNVELLKAYSLYVLQQPYSGEFDFTKSFDFERINDLFLYNKRDVEATKEITKSKEYISYFEIRDILSKMIKGYIKTHSKNSKFHHIEIVLNSLSEAQIAQQVALSHIDLGQTVNNNINDTIVYYDYRSKIIIYSGYEKVEIANPILHKQIHHPITENSLEEIRNKPLISEIKELEMLISSIKNNYLVEYETSPSRFKNLLTQSNFTDERIKDNTNVFPLHINSYYSDKFDVFYKLGGLHTKIRDHHLKQISQYDKDYVFADFDVASFYPFIMVNLGLFSTFLIDNGLLDSYKKIREQRVALKQYSKTVNKTDIIYDLEKLSNITITDENINYFVSSLKIILNSMYGNLNNMYSILFDPVLAYFCL